jgi:hypothetical protein
MALERLAIRAAAGPEEPPAPRMVIAALEKVELLFLF